MRGREKTVGREGTKRPKQDACQFGIIGTVLDHRHGVVFFLVLSEEKSGAGRWSTVEMAARRA